MLILFKWPGLFQSDNINQMITLTVITLSGFYCTSIIMKMSRVEKIMVIEPNMTGNMEENDEDIRIVLEYIQKWRRYCKEREIKIKR